MAWHQSFCADYTDICINVPIVFIFLLGSPNTSNFEDSELFCRDNNHKTIWFCEECKEDAKFWAHFVDNTQQKYVKEM
jgi:hypothetical protein